MKNEPHYVVMNSVSGEKFLSEKEALDNAKERTRDYGESQVVYKAVTAVTIGDAPIKVRQIANTSLTANDTKTTKKGKK